MAGDSWPSRRVLTSRWRWFAAQLRELGALVIDSDVLAREVVAPGSEGLAAVVEWFGDAVLTDAGEESRVARLASTRGMTEDEARSRIAAQATDEQRHEAADVWLDNDGTPAQLRAAVGRLWEVRLAPYEVNLRSGARSRRPDRQRPPASIITHEPPFGTSLVGQPPRLAVPPVGRPRTPVRHPRGEGRGVVPRPGAAS